MFVTHDLSVVKHISDNICVMYLGQLVETTTSKELFDRPLHPYTKALLSAIPSIDIHHQSQRIILKGEIVSPIELFSSFTVTSQNTSQITFGDGILVTSEIKQERKNGQILSEIFRGL